MLSGLARKTSCPLVYCNLVGGNDELIFDGASLVLNRQGQPIAAGSMFSEDFLVVDTEATDPVAFQPRQDEEKIYRALVLGLRDYLHKCGFR
jgi:predicted amidohydrolase